MLLYLPLPSPSIRQIYRRCTITLAHAQRGLPDDEVTLLLNKSNLRYQKNDRLPVPSVLSSNPLDQQRADVCFPTSSVEGCDDITGLRTREDFLLVSPGEESLADLIQVDSHSRRGWNVEQGPFLEGKSL